MSKNIKIIVVEDDPSTALRTESLIYALGYQLVGPVDNSEGALKLIAKENPDILVMDIDINGALNGIEVVEKVKHLRIPVIFTTGLQDEATYQRARKTMPAAYLIKPFDKFTFQSALENVIWNMSQNKTTKTEIKKWEQDVMLNNSFFIKRNNLLQKVNIDDIQYIQSEGNYCDIFSNKKHAVKMSLIQILKKLPQNKFIRIHQRFIIQTDLIDNIDISTNQIYVGGKSLPLGPKYKEEIMNVVNRL